MRDDEAPPFHPNTNPADAETRETLLASYALGAATHDEETAARHLIATDTDAAALAADFAALAGVLPALYADADATDALPGADLKARVLAAARAEMGNERPAAYPDRPVSAPAGPRSPARLPHRRAGRFRAVVGWAAAMVFAATSLGLWNANLALQRDAAPAQTAVSYAARSSHTYAMGGTADAPTANAVLFESPADGGRVVLLTSGFPATTGGQVYRVWLQHRDGSYAAAASFTCDTRGTATVVLPGSLTGVQAVRITTEPDGQPTTGPTGPTVMAGPLRA